jgi:hypothetical protein
MPPQRKHSPRTDYFRIWMALFVCMGMLYAGYQLYFMLRSILDLPTPSDVLLDDVLLVTFQVESPTGDSQKTDLRIPLKSLLKLYLEQTTQPLELTS